MQRLRDDVHEGGAAMFGGRNERALEVFRSFHLECLDSESFRDPGVVGAREIHGIVALAEAGFLPALIQP